ncbi:MAG: hypothetical protein JSU73_06710 [candidate division WOR-3 bacterium]|nr:MAG: hypothetical protein JSU73_06710 [candidate division WOR-3 bacterium]
MNTETAVLAPETRLMLSRAETPTSGQGQDWLGNFLKKHGLEPIVQAWLNDAGLRMVEYFGQVGRVQRQRACRPIVFRRSVAWDASHVAFRLLLDPSPGAF